MSVLADLRAEALAVTESKADYADPMQMGVLFTCTIPGKPIPQGRARVPSFGKPYYPPSSVAFRKLVVAYCHGSIVPPRIPLSVTIEAAGMRANGDLDNLAKGILDALQDAGVIASDDQRTVRELVVRVIMGEPRTVVTITKAVVA